MKVSTTISSNADMLLNKASQLLDKGRVQEALEMLDSSGQSSRAIQNARAVCMLRLGSFEQAMKTLRDLVLPRGEFSIPDNVPVALRVNYAASLLLVGNVVTGLEQLGQIRDRSHPGVVDLRAAVRKWKQSLSMLQRLGLLVGMTPNKKFSMDCPPGALLIPWQKARQASADEAAWSDD